MNKKSKLTPTGSTPTKNEKEDSDVEHIKRFKHRFQRSIQEPIEIIQSIYKNKLPQKCMQHKNTYTVYCENDRKPLCANCTFQSAKHRVHRIQPIKNCFEWLQQDADKMEQQMKKFVDEVSVLINYVNTGMEQMQKQFPNVLTNIQNYYGQLHQFLLQKEQQHIQQLKAYKESMKYQYAVLSAQLRKTVAYIKEKTKHYNKISEQQQLLTKINVLMTLSSSSKLLQEQISLNIKETQRYALNYGIFQQIKKSIQQISPKIFIKINTLKTNKSRSKSQKAQNINKTPDSKSRSKSPITTTKKKQKSIEKKKNNVNIN